MSNRNRIDLAMLLIAGLGMGIWFIPATPYAQAARPIADLKAAQKAAPERVTIDVRSITQQVVVKKGGRFVRIEVTAKVVDVDRSQAGLKAGDVITIRYGHPSLRSPAAGDWAGPVNPDWRYTAWLSATKGKAEFKTAANSMSFDQGPTEKLLKELRDRG